MPGPLSVGKVVVGAFMVPWWNRRAFARALAIPLAILLTFSFIWYRVDEALPEGSKWLLWLLYLLYFALFTLFAVTTHRLVLLDAPVVAEKVAPSWSWRETRFFGFLVLTGAICMAVQYVILFLVTTFIVNAPGVGTDLVSEWFSWMSALARIPALYVFARLALVFPATAVDRRPDLKWAWHSTRANGWRLVLVVAVLPYLISWLIGLLYRSEPTVLETTLLATLAIAMFAIGISALSISYRELTRDEAPA
jgi:hypothetical protein